MDLSEVFRTVNQAGTYFVQGTIDQTLVLTLATAALAANTPVLVRWPANFRYMRGYLTNGGATVVACVATSLSAA
jgi:hypothetical protein